MDTSADLKELRKIEKNILDEAKEIERSEQSIKEHERRILESERNILSHMKNKPKTLFINSDLTKQELHFLRMTFIRKIARHKLLYAILITLTFVLVWRGTWHTIDEIPILNHSLVSLGVGIFLVWLLKKATDLQNH